MTTAALIVAAGQGTRARAAIPKQYAPIGGETVLGRALSVFLDHPAVDLVMVAISQADRTHYDQAVGNGHAKLLAPVSGGTTRQRSVLQGLRALEPHAPTQVLIHDAARPFVTAPILDRVMDALQRSPGAIAAVPLADTLKRAAPNGCIAATVERGGLWRAQTPQGFRYDAILAAHAAAEAAGRDDLTDDAAVAEWAGLAVQLVQGSEANVKLTTPQDMAQAREQVREQAPAQAGISPAAAPDIRTGQGFDVHRFAPGEHVWLCGVRIPHTSTLEGHSDADVGLHALTDALLGAIGDGDIGQHFQNTDPRWRGAASHLFLADAAARVRARGGAISNVDVTLLCEAPKIAPHRETMRARIAEVLGIDISRVGVKATTTEGLGFTGRREGIAALATATVILR